VFFLSSSVPPLLFQPQIPDFPSYPELLCRLFFSTGTAAIETFWAVEQEISCVTNKTLQEIKISKIPVYLLLITISQQITNLITTNLTVLKTGLIACEQGSPKGRGGRACTNLLDICFHASVYRRVFLLVHYDVMLQFAPVC
jgi:hypothetical protein